MTAVRPCASRSPASAPAASIFATSATSLTGVEAGSNGVQAFRAPASRNAGITLGLIGLLAVPMVLGIAYLATSIEGVVAFAGLERTVTSQIAGAVFGPSSVGFFGVQVATAAILFLAANTAYADFPRLASRLADDENDGPAPGAAAHRADGASAGSAAPRCRGPQ